jgi:hypothetical protein
MRNKAAGYKWLLSKHNTLRSGAKEGKKGRGKKNTTRDNNTLS